MRTYGRSDLTLEALIYFLLGALVETFLLWGRARRAGFSRLARRFLAPQFLALPVVAGLALLGVVALIVLLRLSGLASLMVSLDDGWVGGIFVVLCLFLLGAGVLADGLLPRVNERSVLTAQVLVLLLALFNREQTDWVILGLAVGIPTALSIGLLLSRRALSAPLKACAYLGYLFALLHLAYQTANLGLFSASEISGFAGFAFGSLFVFLMLHSLFAVRFFLIVSSLILPRNRPPIAVLMPRLFSDEQAPPQRFGLFALAAALLVLVNSWLQVVSNEILVGLVVLLSAQVDVSDKTEPA